MKEHINEELVDLIQESTKALANDIEELRKQIAAIGSSLEDSQTIVVVPTVGKQPRRTNYLDHKRQKLKIRYRSATA